MPTNNKQHDMGLSSGGGSVAPALFGATKEKIVFRDCTEPSAEEIAIAHWEMNNPEGSGRRIQLEMRRASFKLC